MRKDLKVIGDSPFINRTKGKGEIVVPVKVGKFSKGDKNTNSTAGTGHAFEQVNLQPVSKCFPSGQNPKNTRNGLQTYSRDEIDNHQEPLLLFFRKIILATFVAGIFIIGFIFSGNYILFSASQRFDESKKIITYASSRTNSIFSLLDIFKPEKETGIVAGVEISSTEKNDESLKNGLVVVPLEDGEDLEKNQEFIQKISSSFSDDVDIKPSEDGASGIINPKDNPEDKYLYLMVPVKGE